MVRSAFTPKISGGKRKRNPTQVAAVAIWALFPPGSSRPLAIWRSPVRSRARPMFSRGTDRLTKRLEEAGIRTDVCEFTICRLIAGQAIRDFRMTILRRLP
jgi:hypothetical protein